MPILVKKKQYSLTCHYSILAVYLVQRHDDGLIN